MPHPKGAFEWIFFVPMMVLFVLFAFFMFKSLKIVLTSARAEAIVGNESREEATFQTPDGKTHTARTRSSSSAPLKAGQSVRVYYDPALPDEAYVGIFRELWLVPLVFFVLWFIAFTIWFGTWMGPATPPR